MAYLGSAKDKLISAGAEVEMANMLLGPTIVLLKLTILSLTPLVF